MCFLIEALFERSSNLMDSVYSYLYYPTEASVAATGADSELTATSLFQLQAQAVPD